MTDVVVRLANVADLSALAALRAAWHREALETHDADDPTRDGRAWGYVQTAYVRPSDRGAGVGAALFAAIRRDADAAKKRRLVGRPRIESGTFWQRAGFLAANDLLVSPLSG